MATSSKPWDQQEGESDQSFFRFLTYCFLGPTRSIRRAYEAACREVDSTPCSGSVAPGLWRKDSVDHGWVKRALSYDIALLRERGEAGVIALVDAIAEMSTKLAKAIQEMDGPADWSEALETLKALAAVIPAEALGELLARSNQSGAKAR